MYMNTAELNYSSWILFFNFLFSKMFFVVYVQCNREPCTIHTFEQFTCSNPNRMSQRARSRQSKEPRLE